MCPSPAAVVPVSIRSLVAGAAVVFLFFLLVNESGDGVGYVALGGWLSLPFLSGWSRTRRPEAVFEPSIHYHCLGKTLEPEESGQLLLDVSIGNRVPHMRECGGNGRCTTCRVRVLSGMEHLSEPTAAERRLARLRGWDPTVRLACQARVHGPVVVERMIQTSSEVSRLQLEKIASEAGEERRLAILFCDMRNFTPFAEQQLPFDVVHVLNRFFATLGEPILMNNGVIYQYIGDEITGLFGLTEDDPRAACLSAVRAALVMEAALKTLNEGLRREFDIEIGVGIGIHFGPVIAGQIGHPSHRHFGVIGDAVNVASRIQTQNRETGTTLLVSDAVIDQLPENSMVIGQQPTVALKGKKYQFRLHEVKRFSEPDELFLVQHTLGYVLEDEAAFAEAFYERLFREFPMLRSLFREGNMGRQGELLTHMLKGAIYALGRPADLVLGLRDLGRRHLSYGVHDEHYPLVRGVLLDCLRERLEAHWTEPVAAAWERLVDFVFRCMRDGAERDR